MSRYKEIRLKIFYAFRHKFVSDGAMLPWWGILVRLLLLPIETTYFMLEKKYRIYDPYFDFYTIEGKKYSGLLFHHLSFWKVGTKFEIIAGDKDTVVVKSLN